MASDPSSAASPTENNTLNPKGNRVPDKSPQPPEKSGSELPAFDQSGQRTANLLSLTALGVGAVISGDFFGWNFGLERGGFGGLIVATLLVGLMYICVSLSLAELASMYPSAEGAFRFSRHALGPYAGFCCGLSESLEYVLLVPVIITGLGDQLNVLFNITVPEAQIGWWVLLCIFLAGLHLYGPKTTFMSNVIITACSLLTLFIYWCVCLSIIGSDNDTINDRIYNIPPDPDYSDSTKFLPKGGYGIFTSLVFAAWFFIAVEELPLAGEDAKNPTRDIPRALIGSIIILMTTAFVTAFFSVSVPGGSFNISSTGAPLARALIAGLMDNCVNLNDPSGGNNAKDICNNSDLNCEYNEDEGTCWDTSLSKSALAWEIVINLGTLIGLLNSCHAIIFAGGRQLFSLTRNGIFPPFTKFDVVSKRDDTTPYIALLVDILLAFIVSLIVFLIGEGVDFLVGLSVAAACVSYILSMISYIVLKKKKPDNDQYTRPYKSPLGVIGAGYAAILSLLVGISFFVDIGVGIGPLITSIVIIVFVLIYGLLSIDYKYGCCGKKSGKQRFEEYENKNKYKNKEKNENEEEEPVEIKTQNDKDKYENDNENNNENENENEDNNVEQQEYED